MKVVVTGATGFIGGALVRSLAERGDEVTALSRSAGPSGLPDGVEAAVWSAGEDAPPSALAGADAVVHLAGEPVNGRWTARKREAIVDSRVDGTAALLRGIALADPRPQQLVCASAIGYYGDRGDQLLDEESGSGDDFLADVCRRWEAAASAGRDLGLAVTSVRFGIVLGRDGGALAPLRLATRLGAGGPLGSGRQWWSWIHRDDVVRAIEHVLETRPDRPVNVVAPHAVRQKDFARMLGRALHRPALLWAPSLALEAVLGGFARELLSSRRVSDARLAESGFVPRFGTLAETLADLEGEPGG